MDKTQKKKKIGIDMDDILMEFADNLFKFYNEKFGTNLSFHDACRYELDEIWKLPRDEAIRIVLDYYDSDIHHNSLPVNGAVDFIKKIKPNAEIFIVTARPEKYREITMNWLLKHFPEMFNDVVFTGQYHGAVKPMKKSEVCKELGIEIFIDDALHNVRDVASAGIKTFLFDKPWNREETPENVKRVLSWEEIEV
jgi:uncharacterized protein